MFMTKTSEFPHHHLKIRNSYLITINYNNAGLVKHCVFKSRCVCLHRYEEPPQILTWSSDALSRLPLRLGFQDRPYPSF